MIQNDLESRAAKTLTQQEVSHPHRLIVPVQWAAWTSTVAAVVLVAASIATAQSAQELVSRVENANIAHFSYNVDVSYGVPAGSQARSGKGARTAVGNRMHKAVGGRLQNLAPDGGRGGAGESASVPHVPFVVDVSIMLEEMSGKEKWEFAGMGESSGGRCRMLISKREAWQVDLCVREADGAVLRYDQHLNGKKVAVTHLTYGEPLNGVYLPARIQTYFPLIGQTVEINYENYAVETR